eukprot:scaffold23729_cov19-Tisochrysis_lutea.AAC.1
MQPPQPTMRQRGSCVAGRCPVPPPFHSAAKLNFPVKYLTPGQDPPSIETQIPDQAARDRVEAAVRGSKSSTPGGQK